jgi:hypothetical protein
MTMIDAVITWVDGSDPAHFTKRLSYLNALKDIPSPENNPERWESNDEISLCVRSIELYATWVRKIWIVTDNQIPRLDGISDKFGQRIEIVDHTQIFKEYRDLLPVFSSPSIETFLFRIPGLADKCIYLNDDFFFLRKTEPSDFFSADGKAVLRGEWIEDLERRFPKGLTPYRMRQLNGANMVRESNRALFFPAHVTYTLCRSTLEMLFSRFRTEFERNVSFKFRDETQFSMTSLCANSAIALGNFRHLQKTDYARLDNIITKTANNRRINGLLRRLMKRGVKIGCVNNLGELRRRFPAACDNFSNVFSTSLPRRIWSRTTLGYKMTTPKDRCATPTSSSV